MEGNESESCAGGGRDNVGQVLIKALRRGRKHFTWLSCPFLCLWLTTFAYRTRKHPEQVVCCPVPIVVITSATHCGRVRFKLIDCGSALIDK